MAIAIMLLFFGATTPTLAQPTTTTPTPLHSAHTLYVGGTGPNNYTTIQQALDASTNGDTIYVYHNNAPYHETLTITTSITLQGENKTTTIIKGFRHKDTATIHASNVTITGFTFQGARSQFAAIWSLGTYETITNCIIDHASYGIAFTNLNVQHPSHHRVQANIIRNTKIGIEFIMAQNYSIITDNDIEDSSEIGIGYQGNNATIAHNTINHSPYVGIDIYGDYNLINKNTIQNNTQTYTHGAAGISIFGTNNTITANNLLHCKRNAMQIQYITWHQRFFNTGKNNTWNGNYWGQPVNGTYTIKGRAEVEGLPFGLWIHVPFIGWLPWISYDYHPAPTPIDINSQ